jgi:hypothetical protein
MALSSLWITVVSILATFDITKAVDEKGNVVEPSYEYLSGVTRTAQRRDGARKLPASIEGEVCYGITRVHYQCSSVQLSKIPRRVPSLREGVGVHSVSFPRRYIQQMHCFQKVCGNKAAARRESCLLKSPYQSIGNTGAAGGRSSPSVAYHASPTGVFGSGYIASLTGVVWLAARSLVWLYYSPSPVISAITLGFPSCFHPPAASPAGSSPLRGRRPSPPAFHQLNHLIPAYSGTARRLAWRRPPRRKFRETKKICMKAV